MIKNFILSTVRAFKRQRVYTSINISGLAVGIAVSLMLFLFIQHESGYDRFHEKGDRIFRVISKYTTNNGRNSLSAINFGSVAPEMKKDIPEISPATRIYNAGRTDLVFGQSTYQNQYLLYADHDFFEIFSFNSLYGQGSKPETFNNQGVIISETLAATLFGDKVPLEQRIKIEGTEYTILDVVEVPRQSHIQFDLVISLNNIPELYDWAYRSGLDFHSYGLMAEQASLEQVGPKVNALYNAQMDERFSDFISGSDNQVQALADIYLNSEDISSNMNAGSKSNLYLLSGISLLILFIAIVNYINLTTAQYEKRIKEIGVRKVIGAKRSQLVFQFLGESVLLCVISAAMALGLVQLTFGRFKEIMQIDAQINYWDSPVVLVALLGLVVLLGLLAGLYPALFISAFRPSKILKRDFPGFKRGTRGGKVLVTLQFLVAIVLLTNLWLLKQQINYVKDKDLGFDQEQVLVIDNITEKQKAAYKSIAAELSMSPLIEEVTGAQSALGAGTSGQTVYLQGDDSKTAQPIGELRTMYNFINTHDISLVKGRDFSEELVTDKNAFLINQTGEKMLFPNGEDPLGKVIVMAGRTGPIVGVVEDFHYTNLKRQIAPLVLSLDNPYRLKMTLKLNAANLQASLAHITTVLQQADPSYQLSYFFMDSYFDNMFKAEERQASLINHSAWLAAIISLLGLTALISHSLSKRVKEVAIRKVLGARLEQLLWVLSREFSWVIILANVLAIPLSIWTVQSWLSAFAYRIELGSQWPVFVAVAGFSLLIAMSLIMNQAIRRVRENPAQVLANE